MGTVDKPDIIRKTIVINDDYVRQNRRVDIASIIKKQITNNIS